MSISTDEERRSVFLALTPMQQLILENLGSRYRLGHVVWTFTKNPALAKAAKGLIHDRYIDDFGNVVPGTIRLSLTERGKTLVLDPEYVAPVAQ